MRRASIALKWRLPPNTCGSTIDLDDSAELRSLYASSAARVVLFARFTRSEFNTQGVGPSKTRDISARTARRAFSAVLFSATKRANGTWLAAFCMALATPSKLVLMLICR